MTVDGVFKRRANQYTKYIGPDNNMKGGRNNEEIQCETKQGLRTISPNEVLTIGLVEPTPIVTWSATIS